MPAVPNIRPETATFELLASLNPSKGVSPATVFIAVPATAIPEATIAVALAKFKELPPEDGAGGGGKVGPPLKGPCVDVAVIYIICKILKLFNL